MSLTAALLVSWRSGGMKDITKQIGTTLGTYAVCIPTGNRLTDTTNGFFMTMNHNVDKFAENIRKDPKLRDGFNCERPRHRARRRRLMTDPSPARA